MIEKNTKKNILNKFLIIIGCIVLSIAFAFGLKTVIDYQGNDYSEERPYGDCTTGCGECDGNVCKSCASGYFATNASSLGVQCTKCQAGPGEYCVGSATNISACPDGMYQPLSGQTGCKTCENGQVPNSTKTACVDSIVIYLECDDTSLYVGDSATCNVNVLENGVSVNRGITWGGSSSVISVTGNGVTATVKALSFGTGTVTASYEGVNESVPINVTTDSVRGISVKNGSISLEVGKSVKVETVKVYDSGKEESITNEISFSNMGGIVSNPAAGYIQGIKAGSTHLTVSYDEYNTNVSVTVTNPTCEAGQYLDNGRCETCPPGSYCPAGGTKTPCPDGKYSPANSDSESDCVATGSACGTSCATCNGSVCSLCADGYYPTNGGSSGLTCSKCPAGSYCKDGSKYSCPAGKTSAEVSDSESDCVTAGGACGAACATCNGSVCSLCADGYYPTNGGSSGLTCSKCPAGSYCINGSRNSCPADKYQSFTGQTSCSSCPAGQVPNSLRTACVSDNTHSLTCTPSTIYLTRESKCTLTVDDVEITSGVTFASSNNAIAVVNSSSGVVTGKTQGKVKITATYNNLTATTDVGIANPPCSIGQWRGENSCEPCTGGSYCPDGIARKACPTGKTSSLGAKSEDECYTQEDASKCDVAVSISSKHTSVDKDGVNKNSYYSVKVTVQGKGCNNQILDYKATNAKSLSRDVQSNITDGGVYYFEVYTLDACVSSTATATLRESKKNDSATIPYYDVMNDWKIENGCWTSSQVGDAPMGSHEADRLGKDEYYSEYDATKACYTVHAYREGCGSSNPSDPSTPTENEACYMLNSTGKYEWGKFKNNSNYTLVSGISNKDDCKPSSEGGKGDENAPVYACYKNNNNDYIWAVTAPEGYTIVASVKDEANCKLNDNAACYKDSNGKYAWGDYSNNNSYSIVESIKNADSCNTPSACYKDSKGQFVWGNYAYNSAYTLIANITSKDKCGDSVKVPATGASTTAIIYISIITMLIAGGSFVYYVYNKKKLG